MNINLDLIDNKENRQNERRLFMPKKENNKYKKVGVGVEAKHHSRSAEFKAEKEKEENHPENNK